MIITIPSDRVKIEDGIASIKIDGIQYEQLKEYLNNRYYVPDIYTEPAQIIQL